MVKRRLIVPRRCYTTETGTLVQASKRTFVSALRKYLPVKAPQDTGLPDCHDKSDEDVVFVAVDIEAFEFDQNKITEVGIASLDTRDLQHAMPEKPSDWLRHISVQHLIIDQYRRLINKRFVKGCPEKFHFGVSKVVALGYIRTHLEKAFIIRDDQTQEKDPHATIDESFSIKPVSSGSRKIVFVGHDAGGDVKYMEKLGFSHKAAGTVVASFDTQKIAMEKGLPVGLGRLMDALEVENNDRHNAGNDAAYTMQALVLMALYGHEFPYPESILNAMAKVKRRNEEIEALKAAAAVARAERKAAEQKAAEAVSNAAQTGAGVQAAEENPTLDPVDQARESFSKLGLDHERIGDKRKRLEKGDNEVQMPDALDPAAVQVPKNDGVERRKKRARKGNNQARIPYAFDATSTDIDQADQRTPSDRLSAPKPISDRKRMIPRKHRDVRKKWHVDAPKQEFPDTLDY